ncbi:MAG: hypothetical protein JNM78_05205 [Cyclobacteriaceae bacterium]|nr:hypothetical protein [Cyclobacteriaceae bacterium]
MRSISLTILILLCDFFLFGQQPEDLQLKNEFSIGAVLGSWDVQGTSFLYRRNGALNFRARLDGEIVEEKYNQRNDYVVFRLGADRRWTQSSWQFDRN